VRTFLVILLFAASAHAQQKPRPEIKATAGWVGFIDESWINHTVIGGSARYYLTPRVGVEPEILYMIGPGSDRDVTLIPHISFDFRTRENVRPYVIAERDGCTIRKRSVRFGSATTSGSGMEVLA
jgi:hypothetical protein